MRLNPPEVDHHSAKQLIFGEHRLIRVFISLARLFWKGPTCLPAWLLSIGFFGCLFAGMLTSLMANRWNKFFFDALQDRNVTNLEAAIFYILALCLVSAILAMTLIQVRMHLQLRWRTWLTEFLTSLWLRNSGYDPAREARVIDNPEARIADDGRLSVELLVDLAGGVINSVLLSFSFIFVLWHVGGPAIFYGFTIPGYLVFVVVIYSFATSCGMYFLANPLVTRVEQKAAGEGNFRYALANANKCHVAGISEQTVQARLGVLQRSFADLAKRWSNVISQQTFMMLLTSANSVVAPVIPLLLGAPKFLSGEMTLGDLMQSTAAFWQVHIALNWLADNALSLANWSASARRVAVLYLAYKTGKAHRHSADDNRVQSIS